VRIQNFFSTFYFVLGLVTIGAGVIHFAMIGFLSRWTSKLAIPENSENKRPFAIKRDVQ